jgi:exodeoxyribonuclease VII small subunit
VASDTETPAQPAEDSDDIASELSFREAQTALDLSLAELQARDLDVEQMAGLYRRASRYADRCEQLLHQVEQEVMQWNPDQPDDVPLPYQP